MKLSEYLTCISDHWNYAIGILWLISGGGYLHLAKRGKHEPGKGGRRKWGFPGHRAWRKLLRAWPLTGAWGSCSPVLDRFPHPFPQPTPAHSKHATPRYLQNSELGRAQYLNGQEARPSQDCWSPLPTRSTVLVSVWGKHGHYHAPLHRVHVPVTDPPALAPRPLPKTECSISISSCRVRTRRGMDARTHPGRPQRVGLCKSSL